MSTDHSNPELDKIIAQGKVSPAVAMIVFAVELKSQGQRIDELKDAVNDDNKRYASLNDMQRLEKRVSRVENAILGLLIFVFMLVLGALITLVVRSH